MPTGDSKPTTAAEIARSTRRPLARAGVEGSEQPGTVILTAQPLTQTQAWRVHGALEYA